MTDNEIIKALECCIVYESCEGCPCAEDNSQYCLKATCKNALDLINRQKAEIERFKENEKLICAKCDSIQEKLLLLVNTQIPEAIKSAKSEAIKEVLERVRKLWANYDGYEFETKFDNLVKEMVGDDK